MGTAQAARHWRLGQGWHSSGARAQPLHGHTSAAALDPAVLARPRRAGVHRQRSPGQAEGLGAGARPRPRWHLSRRACAGLADGAAPRWHAVVAPRARVGPARQAASATAPRGASPSSGTALRRARGLPCGRAATQPRPDDVGTVVRQRVRARPQPRLAGGRPRRGIGVRPGQGAARRRQAGVACRSGPGADSAAALSLHRFGRRWPRPRRGRCSPGCAVRPSPAPARKPLPQARGRVRLCAALVCATSSATERWPRSLM